MNEYISSLFMRLDPFTYNHSMRVRDIAEEIEEFYDFPDKSLSTAALVHDIGKVYISSKILNKISRLSDLEREIVDLHPYIGYKLLKEQNVDEKICRIVLYHHGIHPSTLTEIEPIEDADMYDKALMLHSIDCFEALTSDRPYHRGYLANEALDIMLSEKNHHQAFLDYVIDLTDKGKTTDNSVIFRTRAIADDEFVDSMLYGVGAKRVSLAI